ncbi:prephenate dehydrogenase/arogenate dehydrogenase family protein [Marinomonas mediterranea]|uniref:prephenate dehydrogenase/arogenate dehydrogenase family protein n=1 Tax=Marinomonas mediterranea TaxID=119864 RepID=UPI00234992BC|nr:prephenate dehydrogenase/arogenate dehydrogenase family protein [Marinomonas mediterranea]WCN12825.1 prephenate dehydrogenase/arogenate dehydrogenase family protein [Marinomonas mediterranea]
MQDEKVSEHFGNVLIIGLGMIGGSFAKALKNKGVATLFGADRRDAELTLGISTGVIDYAAQLDQETIAQMDVIVLATPVRAMASVLKEIHAFIRPDTLITDVGSTKGSVVEAAKKVFGYAPANFIPGHPIAGAEKSGVLAANPHLFERHMAIVTPLPESDPVLLDRLYKLWEAVGSDVVGMDVEHHDHVLASSSHLPHLLAYTLVDTLANSEKSQDVFKFAAGGFRDFTRIASSDPVMWRDVFLANKEATLATLDLFTDRLSFMRQVIVEGDGASMFGVFSRAKSARDHFLRLLEQRTLGGQSEVKPVSISLSSVNAVKGAVSLTGDKSLSHRVVILAALSCGVSTIDNLDLTGNVKVTVQALRDMGVVIDDIGLNQVRVHGVGLKGLKAPIAPINVHSSLTSLYLLLPVLAGQEFEVSVTADEVLLNRPISSLLAILSSMGATVETAAADCLPVTIKSRVPKALDIALAQFSRRLSSSAMLACLFSLGESQVILANDDGEIDVEILKAFGFNVKLEGKRFKSAPSTLHSTDLMLPADVNKTALLLAFACLCPGSDLSIENALTGENIGSLLPFLGKQGADIRYEKDANGKLPQGRVRARFSQLKNFELLPENTTRLRESLPIVCVLAAFTKGTSKIYGVRSLAYYYEDRIMTMLDGLRHMGVKVTFENDVVYIEGGHPVSGNNLDSAGDYHIALAMLALGIRSREPCVVHDCQKLLEEFTELESVMVALGLQCDVAR